VRSAASRNARLISSGAASAPRPSTESAHVLLPWGGATVVASRAGRSGRGFGHGGSPWRMRRQAPAQRASVWTRGRPAARSAAARASSGERAPPLCASGFWKGSAEGGAVHHAAQKKRRRRVGTTA
jgi:hypothetical protein